MRVFSSKFLLCQFYSHIVVMLSLRLSESFQHSYCSFWLNIYRYTSKIRFKDHAISSDSVSSSPCCSISLDENDSCDLIATDAERQRNQTETERQAWSGSLFTNRDDSVMEMESSSHSTDNVEIRSNPRVSCTNYSEKSVLNSAQGKIDLALSVIIWIEQKMLIKCPCTS